MKNLAIFFLIIFLSISLWAKEEIIFESILKDAIFIPISVLDKFMGEPIVHRDLLGCWTLKFENGAVIRYFSNFTDKPEDHILWIGKKYIVSKRGDMWPREFKVRLIEEK
jgi:hypothetical protein